PFGPSDRRGSCCGPPWPGTAPGVQLVGSRPGLGYDPGQRGALLGRQFLRVQFPLQLVGLLPPLGRGQGVVRVTLEVGSTLIPYLISQSDLWTGTGNGNGNGNGRAWTGGWTLAVVHGGHVGGQEFVHGVVQRRVLCGHSLGQTPPPLLLLP